MEGKNNRLLRRVALAALMCVAAGLVTTAGSAGTAVLIPGGEFTLSASDRNGHSVQAPAAHIIVEISGTYSDAFDELPWSGRLADAECTAVNPDPTWQPNRWGAAAAATAPIFNSGATALDDPQDVYINGKTVDWAPMDGSALCAADHRYRTEFTLTEPTTLNFRVYDPFHYGDNNGGLNVRVLDPEPPAGVGVLIGTALVNANSAVSSPSVIPLVAGQKYRLESTGSYNWNYNSGGNTADAECSIGTGESSWSVNRFAATYPTEDYLDLYVNGEKQDWAPTTDSGGGCNTVDHTYSIVYTAAESGLARFSVKHGNSTVATGSLQVKAFLLPPTAG